MFGRTNIRPVKNGLNARWSSLRTELLVPVEPWPLPPSWSHSATTKVSFTLLSLNSNFVLSFLFQFLDNKPFSFAFRADTQVYFLSLLFCDPTQFPWNRSSQKSHAIMKLPSSGPLYMQYLGCCSKDRVSVNLDSIWDFLGISWFLHA